MIDESPLQVINRPTAAKIAAFQGAPTGFVNDSMLARAPWPASYGRRRTMHRADKRPMGKDDIGPDHRRASVAL